MKTRFMILQSNCEKQIFSVEEREESGDLLIYLPHYKNMTFLGQKILLNKSRKISIHASPNSNPPSHLMKHEIATGGARPHQGYCLIEKPKSGCLVWPIFECAVGTDLPKPKINKKGQDENIRLSAYNGKYETMIYGVFVSYANNELPKIPGLSLTFIRFKIFSIAIYHNFLNAKSPRSEISYFNYSIEPRGLNQLPIIPNVAKPVSTLEYAQINDHLRERFAVLAGHVLSSDPSMIIRPPHRPAFKRYAENFPGGATIKQMFYGLHSIGSGEKNPGAIDVYPTRIEIVNDSE